MADADGGALCARFLGLGGEVIATELEKVPGWDPLRARFERSAKERAGVLYTKGPSATQTGMVPKHQFPDGYHEDIVSTPPAVIGERRSFARISMEASRSTAACLS